MGVGVAVLLDRDGVLNKTVVRADGMSGPPPHAGAVELVEDALKALTLLRHSGFLLVGVTNQPDVARGAQTRDEVLRINELLMRLLPLDDILVCYHDDADACCCRKPKPGLLLQAADQYGLDLAESFMVGDRWKDVAAGRAAGCRCVLLSDSKKDAELTRPDFQTTSLLKAAEWVTRQKRRDR